MPMSDEIAFELVLLDRMFEEYRKLVLDKVGMTREQADEIRRRSPLQYPTLFNKPIESFDGVLIPAPAKFAQEMERRLPQYEDWRPHAFQLVLWPHLLWVVYEDANGLTRCGEFQHRDPVDRNGFDPIDLKPGLWCMHTLSRLADRSWLDDGWEEHVVLHMQFSDRSFEGEFVFGLLQSWKPIAE